MDGTSAVVWVVIAAGSAVGGVLRHLLSTLVGQAAGGGMLPWGALLPWGTLLVNIFGSLAIGVVAGLSAPGWTPLMRHAAMTGVLGGFTTFSSFSLQTLLLVQQGEYLAALVNVSASVVCGLLGCAGGYAFALSLAR